MDNCLAVSSPSVVETRWRVLTAARVFALATTLGLAASTNEIPETAAAFLVLCVLAGVISVPAPGTALQAVAPIAEGALVALVLVGLGNAAAPLLVYLVIPPFVAGLQVGGKWPLLAVGTESVATLAALLAGNKVLAFAPTLERTTPWILVGLGLGLLGSWMRTSSASAASDQADYESAHRLLGQLRAVSRNLSSGLDTSALAEHMVLHTMQTLRAERTAALVRTDGSGVSLLTCHGESFEEDLERDHSVEECWRSGQPQQRDFEGSRTRLRYRTVVPMRVGTRLIGLVVADGTHAADKATMTELRSYLDERSLRLETALLFDDVRTTATSEERHRLAREIHDGIAQEIASLGYLVDDLAANTPSPEGQKATRELRHELSRVVNDLRLSIFDLRSNINPHAGLGLALSDYAREVGKRTGMTVHLALSEQSQRLHVDVETELLRIAQEAITNARKHAKAHNLWVILNTDTPIVTLRVEDDGVGSVAARNDHYGLRIMRERAQRVGGELAVTARPGGGTSVIASVWPQHNSPALGAHRAFSTSG